MNNINSFEEFKNEFIRQGNIPYYRCEKFFEAKKNQQSILSNFPTIEDWKKWGFLSSKDGQVINFVDAETNEMHTDKILVKEYNNNLIIIPEENNALFTSLINGTITWNTNKKINHVYISRHEKVLKIEKIMHDDTLKVDMERNKLGINLYNKSFNPNENQILISKKGQIDWISVEAFKREYLVGGEHEKL